jgi:organic radical activating enzyme
MRLHLQTSGTQFASMPWEWITVSPKCSPGDLKVRIGQEMVVLHTEGLTVQKLREYHDSTRFWFYYIQPLAGTDPAETAKFALHANKGTGMTWALTDQMHKHWGIK